MLPSTIPELIELEAAFERVKRLNELRSRIISTVSHEFRTPLAIIMTSTGLLRLLHKGMTEEQMLARFDRIDEQVKRLAALLDEVATMNKSHLAAHHPYYVSVDLPTFFERLLTQIQPPLMTDSPVTVTVQGDSGVVTTDAVLLNQICSHLLLNAIKFSNPGGCVTLTYRGDAETLCITIKDHGIGIPEADQSHIFDTFHRGSNVCKIPGAGLGLAITREAVEVLGGTITFESAVGSGTTFTVTLPLMR
jgi:signal transduction histidine kinase